MQCNPPGIRRLTNTLTTHAYLAHSRSYAPLIALLSREPTSPVDLLYVKYQRKNGVYGMVPGVAEQRVGESDVARSGRGGGRMKDNGGTV